MDYFVGMEQRIHIHMIQWHSFRTWSSISCEASKWNPLKETGQPTCGSDWRRCDVLVFFKWGRGRSVVNLSGRHIQESLLGGEASPSGQQPRPWLCQLVSCLMMVLSVPATVRTPHRSSGASTLLFLKEDCRRGRRPVRQYWRFDAYFRLWNFNQPNVHAYEYSKQYCPSKQKVTSFIDLILNHWML